MLLKLTKSMTKLETKLSKLFIIFQILSGVSIIAMMMIVTVDATARKLFGNAIQGSYDMVSYLLSIFVFSCFITCQLKNAHFKIDIITTKLSYKVRGLVHSIGFFLSFVVCLLMAFHLLKFGFRLIETHSTAMELTWMPTYPFAWIGALCFFVLALQFFFEAIKDLEKAMNSTTSSNKLVE